VVTRSVQGGHVGGGMKAEGGYPLCWSLVDPCWVLVPVPTPGKSPSRDLVMVVAAAAIITSPWTCRCHVCGGGMFDCTGSTGPSPSGSAGGRETNNAGSGGVG